MTGYNIYFHKNKINNKYYIGITSQKPERRWGKNGENYKLQPKFYNAIKKYGWNNFEHKVLFTNIPKDQAETLEKELIQKYNSIDNGYNCGIGGGIYQVKPVLCITTGQVFNSVNEAAIEAGVSPATMSKYLRGEWYTCGSKNGIRLEWRFLNDSENKNKEENISKKIKKQEEKDSKILEETNNYIEEFINNHLTITEISKKYKVSKQTVSKRLKDANIQIIPSRESRKIQIEQFDKNWNYIQTFESITAALKFLNKTDSETSRIKLACKEQWRIYQGFHWRIK